MNPGIVRTACSKVLKTRFTNRSMRAGFRFPIAVAFSTWIFFDIYATADPNPKQLTMKRVLAAKGYTLKKESYNENRIDIDGEHSSNSHIVKTFSNVNPLIPLAVKIFLTKDILLVDDDAPQWLTDFDKKNKTLVFEAEIYRRVTSIPDLHENIIKFVAFDQIGLRELGFSKEQEEEFFQNAKSLLPLRYRTEATADMLTVNLLATEFTQAKILEEIVWIQTDINKKPFATDYILPIFFQLVWGIQVLQRNGIQHNDMHQGNVFIKERKRSENILKRHYTCSNGDTYFMPTEAPTVLFFDWDWANTPDLTNPIFNGTNHFCTEYGYCGILDEKRDIFRACFQFLQETALMPPEAVDFLRFILSGAPGSSKLQTKGNTMPDIGLLCNKDGKGQCKPYPPNEPSEIRSCAELLAHPCFERYKMSPTMKKDNEELVVFLDRENQRPRFDLNKLKS